MWLPSSGTKQTCDNQCVRKHRDDPLYPFRQTVTPCEPLPPSPERDVIIELPLRRIRADLVFAYKIIFGLSDVNSDDIFTARASNSRRRHCYKLYMPYNKSTARYN